jgi:alpha-beta hydrolase superfamily lysophospholipase
VDEILLRRSVPVTEGLARVDGQLMGRGGVALHWQAWLPAIRPRAVLVVSHGLCDHGGRYAAVAQRLAQDGIATYALDHRGHGRSNGPRANISRIAYTAADLDGFLGLVANEHPEAPRFLCGHSMGCLVSLECVLRHSPALTGLVLGAPTVDVSAAPAMFLRIAAMLSRVAPSVGIIKVYGRPSGDAATDEAVASDPLLHRGRAPARTIAELLLSIESLPARLPRIQLPLLVQHGTDDKLVPPGAASLVYHAASSTDKLLKFYDGVGHDIFNVPEGHAAREDLVNWINARAASPPDTRSASPPDAQAA